MSRTDPPQSDAETVLDGIAACAGVAIGVAHCTHDHDEAIDTERSLSADEIEREIQRLDAATERSRAQIRRLHERLDLRPDDLQRELGPLLDAYERMLGSKRLGQGIRRRIRDERHAAERAVHDEIEQVAARLLALPEEDEASLVRRAAELREIGRRLRRNLLAKPFRPLGAAVPRGAILVADRLSPAEIVLIDPTRVSGIATESGGPADHTSVMLASLGVPAVVGVRGLSVAAREGRPIVLDGHRGLLVLDPRPERVENAHAAVAAEARSRQRLARLRRLPARLASGEDVELQANLDFPGELPLVVRAGSSGIGLLRSEFMFLSASALPDEDVQEAAYRAVITAMGGDPTTIRLLDWGGEKEGDAMARRLGDRPPDANPALSLRGVRLLLADPELLEMQLGAILRAAAAGPVRILVPLVTTPGEMRAVRDALERVARRLRRRGGGGKPPAKLSPLGAMIETPAAALMADAIALDADFLSIGSNDLTMYTLAADRASSDVATLYDPLNPAVLRLIASTVDAGLRLRRPVAICGAIAGDDRLTPLLLGLGLRSFSTNPSSLPRVKAAVRAARAEDCLRLARRALEQTDAADVARLLAPVDAAPKKDHASR